MHAIVFEKVLLILRQHIKHAYFKLAEKYSLKKKKQKKLVNLYIVVFCYMQGVIHQPNLQYVRFELQVTQVISFIYSTSGFIPLVLLVNWKLYQNRLQLVDWTTTASLPTPTCPMTHHSISNAVLKVSNKHNNQIKGSNCFICDLMHWVSVSIQQYTYTYTIIVRL